MSDLVKLNSMPLTEIMKMADIFAASGMFADAKAMGQAFVKIQAGQELGIPPFMAMSGVHIIQGKSVVGAGIIASSLKSSGKYDYKIIELNDKNCSLDFYHKNEKLGNSSFSIENAQKAGTKNIDKFPRNMLFARAISNGVKWFCPDVFSGPVYTPEEFEQTTIDVQHEEVKQIEVKQAEFLSDKKFNSALDKLTGDPIKILTALKGCNLSEEQSKEVEQALVNIYESVDDELKAKIIEIWK